MHKNNSISGIKFVPIAAPCFCFLNLSLNSKYLFFETSSATSVRDSVDTALFRCLANAFLGRTIPQHWVN